MIQDKDEKKKLWQKAQSTDPLVEEFTAGEDKEFDLQLARYDILGSIAHARMLAEVKLLTDDECGRIVRELRSLYHEYTDKGVEIEEGVEDIHSQVELVLTRRLGETGKKIHTGRSRNDQVLLDLRLFLRDELAAIGRHVKALFDTLIILSEKHKDALMPGYTHLQAAMPSSFGLWFAAYAESLSDDTIMLQAVYEIINKNPLGSAAGYGSSFPLNRQMTTDLLGFDSMNYNSVYAQMGRGKSERLTAQALANIGASLAKLAMDICLFNSQNFAFVSFPDALTTGSSIMPHKKNPDIFELIRAKCNEIQALPNTISLVAANLPSGYHRDWQVLKTHLFPALKDLRQCLVMANYAIKHIIIKTDIMDNSKSDLCFSVEAVNTLVKKGLPFRDAYHQVSQEIAQGKFKRPGRLNHTHEGSLGNLCNDMIIANMYRLMKKINFKKSEQAIEGLLKS